MAHDEIIERMARAIGDIAEEMHISQLRLAATAALNALRDTLEPVGWECFSDPSYYDMWCVRPAGSRAFGEGFHLVNGDEAKWLARHLSTLYALPEVNKHDA